ncbi:AhpC/TSA antioxidant enzyme-domain-containing protein [Xylariales sp. PMI_506]|nr:AhpC/TSA antioxidant enzyme-domain-containing protein [Xylariales sp. PMI_506]
MVASSDPPASTPAATTATTITAESPPVAELTNTSGTAIVPVNKEDPTAGHIVETSAADFAVKSVESPKQAEALHSDAERPPSSRSGTNGSTADDINPIDFQGDVATNNNLPSPETIRKLETYTVLDENGKSHTFKSLYTGPNVARRVLVIFVRHFFCGNCQEYLRTLSASVTPDELLRLPVPTSIVVIGCGNPKLIDAYLKETNCPFPVYADNTQHLYRELGMIRTLQLGERPAYLQKKTVAHTVVAGITQALKQLKSGLVLQMGDQKQVGGEFLFEPASLSIESPIATPQDEFPPLDPDEKTSAHAGPKGEEKKITWCHRMRNTRDHAEIPELMEILGLNGEGVPVGNQKKWAKALRSRKGTGLSMASQMSRVSAEAQQNASTVPPAVTAPPGAENVAVTGGKE